MKGEQQHANCRRSKEANSTAPTPLLQDMLQVRWQEPDFCQQVQEMPQRPDEAQKQDAGRKEVGSSFLPLFRLVSALVSESFFVYAVFYYYCLPSL
jgi:hypothetical protein